MDSISETLNKAADLIEKRGWGTGGWEPSGAGPLCIEGAIAAAMGITNKSDAMTNHCPAYMAVRDHIGEAPFVWNDRLKHQRASEFIEAGDCTTYEARAVAAGQAEVIETLRAAAIIAAAKEAGPLTVPDLHTLAATYGGTVTESPSGTRLVGATMAGTSVDLGPVRAVSV